MWKAVSWRPLHWAVDPGIQAWNWGQFFFWVPMQPGQVRKGSTTNSGNSRTGAIPGNAPHETVKHIYVKKKTQWSTCVLARALKFIPASFDNTYHSSRWHRFSNVYLIFQREFFLKKTKRSQACTKKRRVEMQKRFSFSNWKANGRCIRWKRNEKKETIYMIFHLKIIFVFGLLYFL